MPATQRRRPSSVATRLIAEPYRFEFFQAVRVIDLWIKAQRVRGDESIASHVRFENSTSSSFPPSEIESLRVQIMDQLLSGETVASIAEMGAESGQATFYLTPSFMGFLGPNGTLPQHYSERIASHQLYNRDTGPRAFLDTYSNRIIALFYGAWKKYRLELQHESKGENGFLPLLMSLGGLGHPSLRNRLRSDDAQVLDESLAFYAGALSHRPMSPVYLQRILSDYFRICIEVKQFVGSWYPLPQDHQSALGTANVQLGSSALVGQRVWQRDLRIGLLIGPLRRKQFDQFLPLQAGARALEQMLKMFAGLTIEYEIQLILHADDVTGSDLSEHRTGGRLGWDTFLTTQKEHHDRCDVRYMINAL
jgi:type VI secretion system protein ImpH